MEHEVFVPLPAAPLRGALADPARAARAVPGLQQDAGAAPVTGRLKLRLGNTSVTYRGRLSLDGSADGTFTAQGEATEARGTGTVSFTLDLSLTEAPGGTTLTFSGTGTADGRLTELPAETVESALRRLLTRFAENVGRGAEGSGESSGGSSGGRGTGTTGTAGSPEDVGSAGSPEGSAARPPEGGTTSGTGAAGDGLERGGLGGRGAEEGGAGDSSGAADSSGSEGSGSEGSRSEDSGPGDSGSAGDGSGDTGSGDAAAAGEAPSSSSLFDAEVPPPSLEPYGDEDLDEDALEGTTGAGTEQHAEPPAEAAHARRTMIGRSAEEVDHAPPRGRYAPVLAPDSFAAGATLRWAAPAAALVVASAIVVGRALRRRR
ncbi:SRPBCC domain-containing protein [Streptomyces physcomitrii]|uniref:SRPBCC domain-containing protein n=1 Tax=Streptomyces physcomitrii TaxID=2724184 RepID=UPI0033C98C3F